MSVKNYDKLKECGIANIEKLFTLWQIKFTKVTPTEYDFLNPLRDDKNFGAVRFNVEKGIGGDFTGVQYSEEDYKLVSPMFDRTDFHGLTKTNKQSWGFDIIGLTQKIYGAETYTDGAMMLKNDLEKIYNSGDLYMPTQQEVEARKKKIKDKSDEIIMWARKRWANCVDYPGTLAETYLNKRGIYLRNSEPSIKFFPNVFNTEAKKNFPCLLLKISKLPDSPVEAIHRIWIDPQTAGKAPVKMPKKALGNVKGNAIWFGTPGKVLCVAEGPENALSVMSMGFDFVCSTINASNMSNISIPTIVDRIIIFADTGNAGETAANAAKKQFESMSYRVLIKYPKKGDWNDELIEAHKNGQ